MNSDRWEEMKAVAAEVIDHTARSLPAEIQEEARQVPVLFEEQCATDPDILGTYGHFSPNEVGEANGPITLYLVTLAEYCVEEGVDFSDEVRLTYLHELGHHLGWDEKDLEARELA
jgi:predicted Zn-dependent protease with MMP-like domain